MANTLLVTLQITQKGIDTFNKLDTQVQRFAQRTTAAFSQLATLPNLIAGAAIIKIGSDIISAADKMQQFENQMMAVTKTAHEANIQFAAIREFARTSPQSIEDVTRSYIDLRSLGIDPTEKQMRTMSNVAEQFDRNFADVATTLTALSERTLRGLGVEIERSGKTAVLVSGDVRREVQNNEPAIRAALLDVWETRFPDAVAGAGEEIDDKLQVIKNNIFDFSARLGEAFTGQIGGGIDGINKSFEDLRGSIDEIVFAIVAIITPVTIVWNAMQILADRYAASLMEIISLAQLVGKSFLAVRDITMFPALAIKEGGISEAKNKIGERFTAVKDELDELIAKEKMFWSESKNNLGDVTGSLERLAAAWRNAANEIEKAKNKIRGSGDMGGNTEGSGNSSPRSDLREQKISGGVGDWIQSGSYYQKMMSEANAANEQMNAKLIGDYRNTAEQIQNITVDVSANMEKIWNDFAEASKWRFKEAFDTITDLHMSWGQKFSAITEQAYRAATDMLWQYLSAYVKAKFMEGTVSKTTAGSVQQDNLITAGTEAAGAGAAGAKAVAGIPLIGPVLAVAAAALLFGTLSAMISKSKRSGYAMGTDYAHPGWHMVGERGPELAYFRGGEKVLSADKSRGTGPVNISLTINGNANRDTIDYATNRLEKFARDYQNAVQRGYLDLAMVR